MFSHLSAYLPIFSSYCTLKCILSVQNIGRVGKPETDIYIFRALHLPIVLRTEMKKVSAGHMSVYNHVHVKDHA